MLENAITARIGNERLPIGPLELQIAYKLYLGARKDIEDAVHLCTSFRESLSTARLEEWVQRLDVEGEYDRLDAKHENDREQRIEAVKRWVAYIESEPPEVWSPQQNAIVNDQLDAVQNASSSAAHRQRVHDIAAAIIEERDADDRRE